MRNLVARGLLICAVAAGFSTSVQAQDQGYRLLVEDGVDAIAVRHVIADKLGEPVVTSSIPRQMLTDENAAARLRAEAGGQQMIVVGNANLIQAVAGGRSGPRSLRTDLARVLPAESLAVARIN
ncbi:hypothetical protein SAMN06295912_101229 [Sphingomonas laterariae]|uniref:Uncharacterized protein n=2 Tax=Edaphosphingomonas laterariae TaxID=861865 RepID=A0A239BJW8_9SPHN|nr:hypothetical protein SAMN06295912_101229 [Sphingomonas laterariae]